MSLLARDYIKEMHDPEFQQRRSVGRNTFTPLQRESSTSSILSSVTDTVKKLNPFGGDSSDHHHHHHEPVNLMDTSLARYSHSESAPMGEGQLIGSHARKTRTVFHDAEEGGMEDIWLDTSRDGVKQFPNPHDGTKKRQRMLFWALVVAGTCLVVGVMVHRTTHANNNSTSTPSLEAPQLEVAEPVASSQQQEEEEVLPPLPSKGGHGEIDFEKKPTSSPTTAPLMKDEDEEPETHMAAPKEEVVQQPDEEEPEEEDTGDDDDALKDLDDDDGESIQEVEQELKDELGILAQEEETVQEEETAAQGGLQTEILQDEMNTLHEEEAAIKEQEDIVTEMQDANDAQFELLEEEFKVVDEQVETLGQISNLLDEEANGNDDTHAKELGFEIEDLEEEETQLEKHQAAIDQEEIDQLEEEIEGGDGR